MISEGYPVNIYKVVVLPGLGEKSIAPKYIGAVRPQMAIAPKWTSVKERSLGSFGNTGLEGVWARVRWAAWLGFNDGRRRTRTG